MGRKTLVMLLLLTLGLAGAFAYTHFSSRLPPELSCPDCNLIIISLSNLQRKHIGLYGYPRPTTPNIDRFFSRALRFENAIAPASLTYTDSISFFYSLYPYTHRLMARNLKAEAESVLSRHRNLPQILKERGYYSAAFVSDEDYAYEYGLGKTFQRYFDRSFYPEHGILFKPWHYNVGSKDLVAPAADWLKHNSNQKFFMFLQLYDMHCPYNPEPRFARLFDPGYKGRIDDHDCYMTLAPAKREVRRGRPVWLLDSWFSMLEGKNKLTVFTQDDLNHLRAMYDGELRQADDRLEELFSTIENLGLLKNTIVVLMSEHGDYLGENGYYMKAALSADGNLHNANIGLPFLMRLPHLDRGLIYRPLVGLTDLVPTLLQILGSNEADRDGMQGLALARKLLNEEKAHDYIFSGSIRYREDQAVRSEALQNEEWKLTVEEDVNRPASRPRLKLVRLAVDPNETFNLETRFPEVVNQMYSRIIEEREKYSSR